MRRLAAIAIGAAAIPGIPPAAIGQVPELPGQPPAMFRPVDVARVEQAMQLGPLATVLSAEIAAAGDPFRPLPMAARDKDWQEIAARIAPPQRILAGLRAGVAEGMSALDQPQRAELAEALGFWEAPLGRRVVALEIAAREALITPEFEAAAHADYAAAAARNHPRAALVRARIAAGDLVEPAVAVALNITVALLEGADPAADRRAILEQAWSREPALRADQAGWSEALVHVSGSSLSHSEMELLVRVAARPGQRRLDAILQQAATGVFADIARDLGRASTRRLQRAPL